jgi:hypothetical protein
VTRVGNAPQHPRQESTQWATKHTGPPPALARLEPDRPKGPAGPSLRRAKRGVATAGFGPPPGTPRGRRDEGEARPRGGRFGERPLEANSPSERRFPWESGEHPPRAPTRWRWRGGRERSAGSPTGRPALAAPGAATSAPRGAASRSALDGRFQVKVAIRTGGGRKRLRRASPPRGRWPPRRRPCRRPRDASMPSPPHVPAETRRQGVGGRSNFRGFRPRAYGCLPPLSKGTDFGKLSTVQFQNRALIFSLGFPRRAASDRTVRSPPQQGRSSTAWARASSLVWV